LLNPLADAVVTGCVERLELQEMEWYYLVNMIGNGMIVAETPGVTSREAPKLKSMVEVHEDHSICHCDIDLSFEEAF
jgi:hypothetical protein